MPVSLKTEQIIRLKILQKWQTQGIPIKVDPTLLFCFHVYSVKNKQTCEGCGYNSMDEVLPMQT